MPPGRLPREVFQACPCNPTGRRPRGRPRTRWRDYVSRVAWERLGDPPGRAGGSVWGEGGLGISAQTAASATRSQTKRMKMDGWMDGSEQNRKNLQFTSASVMTRNLFHLLRTPLPTDLEFQTELMNVL
ncbi:hypothetical protein L3Q82_006910 [Scortum barcoo]|uniref:Uncharacterized protein n=1 Tax=Scortum barcoo TaxID=214431 RepID=A0ACB8WW62_9TELE|nr:hypothetical protein L3Q82_006910 [Scortum barcoo]